MAHVVVRDGAPGLGQTSCAGFLAGRLPDYMVPTTFVAAVDLPRTPSGKIDRRGSAGAAAAPGRAGDRVHRSGGGAGIDPGRGVGLAEVLKSVSVGNRDNFFELGGDSLTAARIFTSWFTRTGHDVPIAALFRHPSVAAAATHLGGPAAPVAAR
ncbi:MAG: phosphopantetheine-binding protein [Gemmataceae bacterium]